MLTLTGAITGPGALVKADTGTLRLGSTGNDYSGDTGVNAGTLRAGAANAFSPNSAVTVASAGTLDLAGFNQTVAALRNAGLVVMGIGAAPGTVLTVRGNYVDPEGLIVMNTWLGDSSSPTDRLVIGGTATGTTSLLIANAGGPGALTTGNGIELVHMANGGASAGAFTLAGRVVEGAYEYRLFHGSTDASGPQNWYLRSDVDCTVDPGAAPCQVVTPPGSVRPDYRAEASLYSALPAMQMLYDRTLVDSLNERVGDMSGGIARSGGGLGPSQIWGRMILTGGTEGDAARGLYGDGARYRYGMTAVQMGVDLYRSSHDHVGVYGAWGEMNANVAHWDANAAGKDRLKTWTAGGYWSHFGESGWYSDLVAQYSWSDMRAHTIGLDTVDMLLRQLGLVPATRAATIDASGNLATKGRSFTASLEAGKVFAIGSRTVIEPQGQIVWQKGSIDGFADPAAAISFGKIERLEGRLGARIARNWSLTPNAPDRLTTLWIRPSVRYVFQGRPETAFAFQGDTIPFRPNLKGATLDLTAGVDAQITRNLSAFASGNYLQRLQNLGASYGAKAGLRLAW
jgi:fibronectin-binding autotransporter adhesin